MKVEDGNNDSQFVLGANIVDVNLTIKWNIKLLSSLSDVSRQCVQRLSFLCYYVKNFNWIDKYLASKVTFNFETILMKLLDCCCFKTQKAFRKHHKNERNTCRSMRHFVSKHIWFMREHKRCLNDFYSFICGNVCGL